MTQMIRNLVTEQQNLSREMVKLGLANHEMAQKHMNLAMENTRSSIEMARDISVKATKVMTDAMLPEKTEA
jgi:hypothetical protein